MTRIRSGLVGTGRVRSARASLASRPPAATFEQIFGGASYIDATFALSTMQLHKHSFVTARDTNVSGDPAAITVAQLKAAASPRLLPVGGYVNGSYVAANRFPDSGFFASTDAYARSVNDPTKYLRDVANGVNTPLLNPLSPLVYDYLLAECQRMLTFGFDWLFFDNLGWSGADGLQEITGAGSPTGAGNNIGVLNPLTGLAWTHFDWMTAWQVVVGALATALGVPVACNGLGNGQRYFDVATKATSALWDSSRAACAEIWQRSSTASLAGWPNESNWRKDEDLLLDATARGKRVLSIVKNWPTYSQWQTGTLYAVGKLLFNGTVAYRVPSGHEHTSTSIAADVAAGHLIVEDFTFDLPTIGKLIDQWHRFSLGSFLLVDDGRHALEFTSIEAGSWGEPNQRSVSVHNQGQPWYPEWENSLGSPLRSFTGRTTPTSTTTGIVEYKTAGYYRRDFTGGVVIVNPTTTATGVIDLLGTFAPLSARLSPLSDAGVAQTGSLTSITLAAHDAAVLVRA